MKVLFGDLNDILGTFSTLQTEGIRSPNVRAMAEMAIQGKDDHIAAVFDLVKSAFPYTSDPFGRELFIAPNRLAEDWLNGKTRGADCDDYALLCSSLLGSIGYRTRVAVMATGGQEYDHAVCQAFSEELKDWVNVDPSSSDCPVGWSIPYSKVCYANPG